MPGKGVRTQDLLSESWVVASRHLGLLAGVVAVYFAAVVVLEGINVALLEREGALRLAGLLLTACLNGLLSMGLLAISLKLGDGGEARFGDLFASGAHLLSYLISLLLYYLLVLAGLLLLIVPGLIWSVRCSFFPLLILDRRLGPVEALRASNRITRGATWNLSWVWGVLVLLNMAGALLLGVGLFLTIPITLIAYARAYRFFLRQTEPPPLPDQPAPGGVSAAPP